MLPVEDIERELAELRSELARVEEQIRARQEALAWHRRATGEPITILKPMTEQHGQPRTRRERVLTIMRASRSRILGGSGRASSSRRWPNAAGWAATSAPPTTWGTCSVRWRRRGSLSDPASAPTDWPT